MYPFCKVFFFLFAREIVKNEKRLHLNFWCLICIDLIHLKRIHNEYKLLLSTFNVINKKLLFMNLFISNTTQLLLTVRSTEPYATQHTFLQ